MTLTDHAAYGPVLAAALLLLSVSVAGLLLAARRARSWLRAAACLGLLIVVLQAAEAIRRLVAISGR